MPKPLIIAIDGPSGVGKGTIARAVARALNYRHVDTGIMYRVVAWLAVTSGIALNDEAALERLATDVHLEMKEDSVAVDGIDVTREIRTPAIDRAAAAVAKLSRVRSALVVRQRQLGAGGGIVMEGRDIGTVVFPHADVKIFLDASPEERARRRAHDEAPGRETSQSLDAVAAELAARDEIDRTRAASPLTVAPEATVIDTTSLPIPEVVARVLALVKAKERVS